MDIFAIISQNATEELVQQAKSLPIQLTVMDIANFLGISRTSAYKLTHSEGFPAVRLKGFRRLIIPKNLFLDWFMAYLKEAGVSINIDTSQTNNEL